MITPHTYFGVVLCLFAVYSTSHAAEPLIVAHRGLLNHAPENTLANFRACLELRPGFEFDVQKSKDGHLVCIHDDTVDRTTDGTGTVSEMTLAEIRELDAGNWFDPRFEGEKVPTINEVLKLIAEYRQFDILVAVDLKAEHVEADVVKLAVKYDVLDKLIFIGRTIAESKVRQRILETSTESPVAIVAHNAEEFSKAISDQAADWVYVRFLPSSEDIKNARNAKKKVFIAGPTVASELPENWRHTSDVGIDGILTDYPLELRSMLRADKKR